MKRPEIVLDKTKIYVPIRFKAGKFKKQGDIVVNCTFVPLICTELYKNWTTLQFEIYEVSKNFVEKSKIRKKKPPKSGKALKEYETAIEELEEETISLTKIGKEVEDVLFKLLTAIIETNDNPPEYATKDWIALNFVPEDIKLFIDYAMSITDSKKK